MADGVALEQPYEGCFLFIPLLSQHLEEEKEATYANMPSAPQPREELYSTLKRV